MAIARAVVMGPAMVLADEPTGNLDTKSGLEIVHLLERMNDDGLTVLVVTHNPRVAERAKHKIALTDGRLASDVRNPEVRPAGEPT